MKRPNHVAFAILLAAGIAATSGCDTKSPSSSPSTTPAPKPATGAGAAPHDHDHDHDHDHGHSHSDSGQHGTPLALGESTIGPYTVKASRDDVEFKAGGDAPIDVTVDPAAAGAPKIAAVRFWIGTQDAAGSLKAKADVENAAQPNRWHTHAEIPDPIPADSLLWVAIEDAAGSTHVGSFPLKR